MESLCSSKTPARWRQPSKRTRWPLAVAPMYNVPGLMSLLGAQHIGLSDDSPPLLSICGGWIPPTPMSKQPPDCPDWLPGVPCSRLAWHFHSLALGLSMRASLFLSAFCLSAFDLIFFGPLRRAVTIQPRSLTPSLLLSVAKDL